MKNRLFALLSFLLALLLSLSLFAACKKNSDQATAREGSEEDGEPYDPDSVDSEGHKLPQPTISTARIAGDYTITGSFNWDDFTDDEKDETGEVSFTMNVFPGGENALSVTLIPTDETLPSTGFDVTDYDPLKGTCTLPDVRGVHGVVFPVSVTFSESGGKIAVSMQFDKTYEGEGRVFGSYEGLKK